MTPRMSRRGFVAIAAAVIDVGPRPDGTQAASGDATALNPFARIDPDGRVTAIIKYFERDQRPFDRPDHPDRLGPAGL